MATSTRRTWQGGQIVNESVQQSQSARARLAQRIGDRVQRQQPPGTGGERPSLGATLGRVQRLGGNPVPDRRFQGSGAVPVGGAVQSNQGISTGAPAGLPPEWFQPEPDLNVALLVSGVPTIENARPRTDVDFAIDVTEERLYRWDNDDGEAGDWVPISSGSNVIFGPNDPNSDTPWQPNTIFYSTRNRRSYLSVAEIDGNMQNLQPQWVPMASITIGPSYTSVYPGDLFQGTDGAIWIFQPDGTWRVQFFCPECEEEPDDSQPPSLCQTWLYDRDIYPELADINYFITWSPC